MVGRRVISRASVINTDLSSASLPRGNSALYPCADSAAVPLKALLLVPPLVPRWMNGLIALAAGDGQIEISVLVAPGLPGDSPSTLSADLHLCLRMERRRRSHAKCQVAYQAIDYGSLAHCSELKQTPVDAHALHEQIESIGPDVILSMAPATWNASLADCARLGCWTIGPDLTDRHSAGVSLLTPILAGEEVTQAGLELRNAQGGTLHVESCWTATSANSFDLQRDQVFHKLPALLMRILRKAHATGLLPDAASGASLVMAGAPIHTGFGVGLKALLVAFSRSLGARIRRRYPEPPWFLLLREGCEFLDPAHAVFNGARAIVAPRDDYWADPCLAAHAGRRFVFVEEFATSRNIGLITCLELLSNGEVTRLGIVLDEPCHLSYPSIFEWEGHFFMTVETGSAGRVSLYKARNFPLEWDRISDLLEGRRCVDPTLYFHEGHWYLFTNVSESGGGTSDELFLFVSEALEGPYIPHPCNPIVTDVRCARPAGHLFVHDGRLVRPAQSCVPVYGAAIIFNEVTALTPALFHECQLSRLEPSCRSRHDGCHTYSRIESAEVIDTHGLPPEEDERRPITHMPLCAKARSGDNPLVSAIVPAYNAERFLAQAIESALAQTLESSEIVIVDDGSTDGTGQIADHFSTLHPGRVRVIHQQNQGLPFARNTAIGAARGRYLALLDADDAWLPGHLESCVALLEKDPELGLVHANDETIDVDGNLLRGSQTRRWLDPRQDPYTAILLRLQHVNCPTAVFRKSIVDAIGPFDGLFNRLGCEDRDMWLRLAEVSKFAYIDEIQALYRVHGGNMSANHATMIKARQVLIDKHALRAKGRHLRRRAVAAVHADHGHELARHAPVMPALQAFGRAIYHDPMRIDAWKGLVRRIVIGRRP